MHHLPAAVVFDLDGTLVDTAPDLTAALNHVMALEGHSPVPQNAVQDMIGSGARALIEQGLRWHGQAPEPDRVQARLADFLRYYANNICEGSRPYPGVTQRLEAYRMRGIRLGICTNKPVAMSVALIEALGLSPFFMANLGADSLDVRKPDPRHLLETIARIDGAPQSTVMVGDSMTDVNTARNAGVPIVAVSFGYTTIAATEFGADALIDHFDALDDALARAHLSR
jgi:phosphoglycolate phosphatase